MLSLFYVDSGAFLRLCSEHDGLEPFGPLSCLELLSDCCLQEARKQKKFDAFQLAVFPLVFNSTYQYYLFVAQALSARMCGHFVFDQNVLGLTYPFCIKSSVCHPLESLFYIVY